MRLTCPNCLTEYDVPEAAVAGRARTLRCAYCGHQWRREAAEAAAGPNNATAAPVSETPAAGTKPDLGADPAVPEAPLIDAPPLLPPQPEPPAIVPFATQKPPVARRPMPPRPAAPPPRRRRWPLAVLLFLIVLTVAGLAAHRPIARAWPASAPFFQSLGLK